MKQLIYFLFFLLLISCKNKNQDNIYTATEFPEKMELKSEVIIVPPILLYPENMCISNNQLIVLSTKKDTLFDFFQLPKCNYLFSAGLIGGGPNDLPPDIDSKFLQTSEKGK
jgi:hypothetical protein